MFSPLSMFPHEWRTFVTVIRSGGRDYRGNPKPPERIIVEDCLIGPRATSDPVDRSDLVAATAVLYHKDFPFHSTDRIEVPVGARMAGTWAVDGRPGEWPYGIEVPLTRA